MLFDEQKNIVAKYIFISWVNVKLQFILKWMVRHCAWVIDSSLVALDQFIKIIIFFDCSYRMGAVSFLTCIFIAFSYGWQFSNSLRQVISQNYALFPNWFQTMFIAQKSCKWADGNVITRPLNLKMLRIDWHTGHHIAHNRFFFVIFK